MGRPIELVPLLCPKCETPIPAYPGETAWVCGQCSQASLLDESQGLVPVETFYAAGIPQGQRGKPFWMVEGRVRLQRSTYKGNQDHEAEMFWAQPRRFIIPAFACPFDFLLQVGKTYLTNSPRYQEGPVVPVDPVVLSIEDVCSAAEFIVMAVEAERKDKLKEIRMELELTKPVLWVLP